MNLRPSSPPPERPPLVLVADDAPGNGEVVKGILEDGSLRVLATDSGAAALELARTERPDLVLLDVQMPGMDGLETCAALKAEPATREIPIIFITARTGVEDIVRGFQAGAVDYVAKPFEPMELRARVRLHLDLKARVDRERALVAELQEALAQVKLLSGLVPICAHCKKVRDDQGFWQQVEAYVSSRSEATFSHGICPDCVRTYFPGARVPSAQGGSRG